MPGDQEKFLQWLYRQTFSDSSVDFKEVVHDAALNALEKDSAAAGAIATKLSKRYWNAAKKRADNDVLHGRHPVFSFLDDDSLIAKWHPATLSSQGQHVAAQALRARPAILNVIDELSDREYEAMACVTISLAGANEFHLTPQGNEGGIDFFAILECETRTHLFGYTPRALRIVGQCKKYEYRDSVTRFNSFLKALENVRHIHKTVQHHIPNWFRRGYGPLIGWYIAHNGLQSGAMDAAKDHGVIISDSVDIAQSVTETNRLGDGHNVSNVISELRQRIEHVLVD